jgi:hypothetical protein
MKRSVKAKSDADLMSVAKDGKPTPQPRPREGNAGLNLCRNENISFIRDESWPYWTSRENYLELIKLSSINKVSFCSDTGQ